MRIAWTSLAFVSVVAAAVPAAAQDPVMGPFTAVGTVNIGLAAGGVRPSPSITLGGSVAVDEQTGWGAELDVSFIDGGSGEDARASLQTYLLSAHWMWPQGKLRPYLVGGFGGMVAHDCGRECSATADFKDWLLGVGAGAHYLVSQWVAVRGDVRYLTTLNDHPQPPRLGRYDLWRVTGGVSVFWKVVP